MKSSKKCLVKKFETLSWLVYPIFQALRSKSIYVSIHDGLVRVYRGLFKTGTFQSNVEFRLDQISRAEENPSGSRLTLVIEEADPIRINFRLVRSQDRMILLNALTHHAQEAQAPSPKPVRCQTNTGIFGII